MLLEICVENIDDATAAASAGADRIELCANLAVGGTTPSYAVIELALSKLDVPFYPIIRPRGGNFVYNQPELKQIIEDIIFCKNSGCKGIVVGVLNHENKIDTAAIESIIDAKGDMQITFHKAFDEIKDQLNALQILKLYGINNVLTSGGASTALIGQNQLHSLINHANQDINILIGGGVRSSNLNDLMFGTTSRYFHSRATNSNNCFDSNEVMSMQQILKSENLKS